MATNIPPHNLGEVVDALIALIHNPNASVSSYSFLDPFFVFFCRSNIIYVLIDVCYFGKVLPLEHTVLD